MTKLPARTRGVRAAIVAFVWALSPAMIFGTNQPCSVAAMLHRPCPGCGLTRATLLLLHGDVRTSLAMHPLALPMIACWAWLAIATIRATWIEGVPWHFSRERFGRAAIVATALAYVALFALWVLREEGFFGGRVPIMI